MAAHPVEVNTGDVFGRLTVKHAAPNGPNGHRRSVCVCTCGNEVVVNNSKLVSGHTRSCGCIVREQKPTIRHGESYTRLHSIWRCMKGRCNNPNDPAYHYYGARGICVCREWNRSYEAFAKWARSHGYTDELTLDRIDVNDGYKPSNCRFITKAEQQRNRRDNHLITYKGETHCLEEWARITGINSGTLNSRINRQHWSVKHALEEPPSDIGRHGAQRPYDIYGRHPIIEQIFDGHKTYPSLAEAMAKYIEELVS